MVTQVKVSDPNVDGVNVKLFDLSKFKSNITTSFHRPSQFHMFIPTPSGLQNLVRQQTNDPAALNTSMELLAFNIEKVTAPGISMATDQIRRQGFGQFDRKPYVPVFEEINVIVRSDSEGKTYDFFQNWMKLIINYDFLSGGDIDVPTGLGRNGAASPYEVNYKGDYAIDNASIIAYSEDSKISINTQMRGFYPVYLGEIEYDWSAVNAIVKFPVRFTFSDWKQSRSYGNPVTTNTTTTNNG